MFHWLDTNHDGFLTFNEFLAAPWVANKQQARRIFQRMDTNKDGLVNMQEFLAVYGFQTQDYVVSYPYVYGANRYCAAPVYPWGYWWLWRSGWYWHSGWHRRTSGSRTYAGYPWVSRPQNFVNHGGRGGHLHSVGHVRLPAHHGTHIGHGHPVHRR
jgi:hypothetical protein